MLTLTPHPDVIRALLARYHRVQMQHAQAPSHELQRQLEDVTYTLCVSTGTVTVYDALVAADAVLTQATPSVQDGAGTPSPAGREYAPRRQPAA